MFVLANTHGKFLCILMRGSSPHQPVNLTLMQIWLKETQWGWNISEDTSHHSRYCVGSLLTLWFYLFHFL